MFLGRNNAYTTPYLSLWHTPFRLERRDFLTESLYACIFFMLLLRVLLTTYVHLNPPYWRCMRDRLLNETVAPLAYFWCVLPSGFGSTPVIPEYLIISCYDCNIARWWRQCSHKYLYCRVSLSLLLVDEFIFKSGVNDVW